MGIVLFSLVGAYDLVAGEPYPFDLNETYEYYSIVGNLTPINLTVTQEGTIATILVDKYSPSSNFELVFFNQETEVITEHHYSSGSTKYVDKEVLVEVPNYVDREVEVIVEKEVPGEVEVVNKLPKWVIYLLSLLGILGIIGIVYLIVYYFISKINERREINED